MLETSAAYAQAEAPVPGGTWNSEVLHAAGRQYGGGGAAFKGVVRVCSEVELGRIDRLLPLCHASGLPRPTAEL